MPELQIAEFTIGNFTQQLLGVAIVIVSMGTVSMALLDVIKGIFRVRYFFHRWYLSRWISRQLRQITKKTKRTMGRKEIEHQLLELSAGSGTIDDFPMPFGDLSTKAMFARIRGSAHSALDFPETYQALYDFFTEGLLGADNWQKKARKYRNGDHRPVQPGEEELSDTRLRIGAVVDRRLDIVEGDAQWWWNSLNQLGAMILCVLLFSYVFQVFGNWKLHHALLISVFGGILAPFAKDLASKLSQVQARRTAGL